MLTLHRAQGERLVPEPYAGAIPDDTIWIDCLQPTREEDAAVERFLGVGLPTREEMQEIEPSSRLAVEDGALYLTAAVLCGSEGADPRITAVTFVVTPRHIATVRYDQPGMMPVALARTAKPGPAAPTAAGSLIVLLEAAIDRLADVTERTGETIETLARSVFEAGVDAGDRRQPDHRAMLNGIGRAGMRLGLIAESLISFSRLLIFLIERAEPPQFGRDDRARMKTMLRDVTALSDHIHALEDRVTFLLEATLGLVSIRQNETIKIFSVLAVIFLPPTLVASAYGMNFRVMPELEWAFGYPFALALMVASAVLTWVVFRWRGWL